MLRRLLIFLLILFLVSETIRGCGVLTHTEIVHRAVQKLLADGIRMMHCSKMEIIKVEMKLRKT